MIIMDFMMCLRLHMISVTTKGLALDIKRRVLSYRRYFIACIAIAFGSLAPTIYTFLSTLLPVIAFGEQLSRDTDGSIASAAICGIIHFVLGGQSSVVPGVSEPTIIIYTYMYKFAIGRQDLGEKLYLAWAAWACTWTALVLLVMSINNTCAIFRELAAISGDAFRMLIIVLFLKQAVQGLVSEFTAPISEDPRWLYTYGLLTVVFIIGLLCTALKRSRIYGKGVLTRFIPGYALLVMVLVSVSLSFYVPSRTLSNVSQKLASPVFGKYETIYGSTLIKDMVMVPVEYILATSIPAIMIAGIYFFEHSVALEAASHTDSNSKNLSSKYDILILGFSTLLCGLIGLPPSCGVLFQSNLAVIRRQLIRNKMVGSAHETMKQEASSSGSDSKSDNAIVQTNSTINEESEGLKVNNLVISMLLVVCIWTIVRLIKLIPRSVLFRVHGSRQSPWSPILGKDGTSLLPPPGRRHKLHSSFSGCVPYRTIVRYTVFQIVYFVTCFAMSWIPISGILFPVPFFILTAIRQLYIPKIFHPDHLAKLGEAEDEDVVTSPSRCWVYIRPKLGS